MNKKKIIDKLLIVSIVVMAVSGFFDKTDRRDDGSHCYA